jgi:hypothetical protein
MSEQMTSSAGETLYCYYHPNTPTTLRCNRCNKPICTKDAVRTAVGYRCKTCVRQQQDIFFNATPADYVIAAVVALPIGYLAQRFVPQLGFFVIFLGPAIGGLAGEAIWRVTGRRRGRYVWAVALASLTAGALAALWPQLQVLFLFGAQALTGILWDAVFFVLMAGAFLARLRLWR